MVRPVAGFPGSGSQVSSKLPGARKQPPAPQFGQFIEPQTIIVASSVCAAALGGISFAIPLYDWCRAQLAKKFKPQAGTTGSPEQSRKP